MLQPTLPRALTPFVTSTRGTPLAPLALAALSLLFACQDQQLNGSVYRGTDTKTLSFGGRTDTSGAKISVQYLRSPNLAPETAANWTTARAATGSNTAQTWNSSTPYYDWGKSTITLSHGTAWPRGGVLRLRSTMEHPTYGTMELSTFDEDYQACREANASALSWLDIGTTCQTSYPRRGVTHVVNTALDPTDATNTPPYLTRKRGKFTASNLGAGYYSRVAIDLPAVSDTREIPTLRAFRSIYGFTTGSDVSATYYNHGDLGLGREMHCREFSNSNFGDGVACYVTNYTGAATVGAPFGALAPELESSAIADAIARSGSVATVAMVYYSHPPSALYPDNLLFMVFNGNGELRAVQNNASEVLLTTAKLDNRTAPGGNELPSNCVTCHGGSVAVAGSGAGRITHAFLLPFDLQAFRFSTTNSTFSRASQEEAFRKLNAMVLKTNATDRIKSLVNDWYGGDVKVANRRFDNDAVPSGWKDTDAIPFAEKLYKYVFEPYCQGCHLTQDGQLGFANAADFVAAKPLIAAVVCGGSASADGSTSAHGNSHSEAAAHSMPHSEMAMSNFWNSSARAHLVAALDLRGACN